MIGSLLSSISKHNMWSYYDWVVIVIVSKRNMWSYYDWVCLLTDDNDYPIIIWSHIVFTDGRQWQPNHKTVVVIWLGCHCRPSVNTICGRIMIGSLLSSISKHNMWFIMRPHIVFTDGQQQRQPNHNTTHIMFTDGRKWQICGRVMIRLSLLSSVSKHNMWSYYDWVVFVFPQ
jgi:hypothetical protein